MKKCETLLIYRDDLIDKELGPLIDNFPVTVFSEICNAQIVFYEGRLIKNQYGPLVEYLPRSDMNHRKD